MAYTQRYEAHQAQIRAAELPPSVRRGLVRHALTTAFHIRECELEPEPNPDQPMSSIAYHPRTVRDRDGTRHPRPFGMVSDVLRVMRERDWVATTGLDFTATMRLPHSVYRYLETQVPLRREPTGPQQPPNHQQG